MHTNFDKNVNTFSESEYNIQDICNSCIPVCVMQLFCHPKYSILYGALMIFVVGSGQE